MIHSSLAYFFHSSSYSSALSFSVGVFFLLKYTLSPSLTDINYILDASIVGVGSNFFHWKNRYSHSVSSSKAESVDNSIDMFLQI